MGPRKDRESSRFPRIRDVPWVCTRTETGTVPPEPVLTSQGPSEVGKKYPSRTKVGESVPTYTD